MLLQTLLNVFVPFAIALGPLFLLVGAVILIRKRRASRRKNPINIQLLRGPGQTLLDESEDMSIDLFSYLLLTPFASLLLYAYYLTTSQTILTLIIFVIASASFILFFAYKIIKLSHRREKLRLGYDAELAIGQELNLLMRKGFFVFHDVNLKNTISEFNIDHIVVGKSGVFAVETKGRSKPINSDGKHAFKVNFDGKSLVFPQWKETEPVIQAKRQSTALQKWLSSATGEAVTVKAVLALPGWFITTTKKTDVAVINGKNPENYFNVIRQPELSAKQIKQIAHQLESLCRNIEPKAYTMPK